MEEENKINKIKIENMSEKLNENEKEFVVISEEINENKNDISIDNSSRKRGRQMRVIDSDDDSDYSDGSRTPNSCNTSLSRSPSSCPPSDDTILLTPPKRRKSIIENNNNNLTVITTEEKNVIIPPTPMNNANLKKISIWKRLV